MYNIHNLRLYLFAYSNFIIGLFLKNLSRVQRYVYDLISTTIVYHIVYKVFTGMILLLSSLLKNRKLRYNYINENNCSGRNDEKVDVFITLTR